MQAQVYRVFYHANWPIKRRHSHWLCCLNVRFKKLLTNQNLIQPWDRGWWNRANVGILRAQIAGTAKIPYHKRTFIYLSIRIGVQLISQWLSVVVCFSAYVSTRNFTCLTFSLIGWTLIERWRKLTVSQFFEGHRVNPASRKDGDPIDTSLAHADTSWASTAGLTTIMKIAVSTPSNAR